MMTSSPVRSVPDAVMASERLFCKMQAVGNDFVLFDARAKPLTLAGDRRRSLADRRFGIGCDQLIVLNAAADGAQFSCRFYNADGGEAGMCGNGLRCIGHYLHTRDELVAGQLTPVACAGRTVSLLVETCGDIRVDMGAPAWESSDIPAAGPAASEVQTKTGPVEFIAVSMGNPHAVIRVPDAACAPLDEWGTDPIWRSLFPEGVNIGCMDITDRRNIRLRVYERGTGETLGCGSGACAAVAVGHRHGWLDPSVRVRMGGGDVSVVGADDGTIWLSGPAAQVYEGRIVI